MIWNINVTSIHDEGLEIFSKSLSGDHIENVRHQQVENR